LFETSTLSHGVAPCLIRAGARLVSLSPIRATGLAVMGNSRFPFCSRVESIPNWGRKQANAQPNGHQLRRPSRPDECRLGRASLLAHSPCWLEGGQHARMIRGNGRCSYSGGLSSGDRSHSLMCEPVSHWRALRRMTSRSGPGGSALACSRRRFASVARRSSRVSVCLKRRRIMTPPRAYGS
jgi:hypothetical protein